MRGDYFALGQLTQANSVADLVFALEGPAYHRPKKPKRSLAQLCRTVVGALSAHKGDCGPTCERPPVAAGLAIEIPPKPVVGNNK